ncbi:MAG: hypothetical protein QF773_12670, partial [Lentisphaeria bacterium]|nr:hypothetical protein [Lentisphaeria bacterium]
MPAGPEEFHDRPELVGPEDRPGGPERVDGVRELLAELGAGECGGDTPCRFGRLLNPVVWVAGLGWRGDAGLEDLDDLA